MKTKSSLLKKLLGKDAEKFAKSINQEHKKQLFIRWSDSLANFTNNFFDPKAQQEYIDADTLWKLQLEKEKKSQTNKANAKKPRKKNKPSKEDLLGYKYKFEADHGNERGWKKSAQIDYSIDAKTLIKILKE